MVNQPALQRSLSFLTLTPSTTTQPTMLWELQDLPVAKNEQQIDIPLLHVNNDTSSSSYSCSSDSSMDVDYNVNPFLPAAWTCQPNCGCTNCHIQANYNKEKAVWMNEMEQPSSAVTECPVESVSDVPSSSSPLVLPPLYECKDGDSMEMNAEAVESTEVPTIDDANGHKGTLAKFLPEDEDDNNSESIPALSSVRATRGKRTRAQYREQDEEEEEEEEEEGEDEESYYDDSEYEDDDDDEDEEYVDAYASSTTRRSRANTTNGATFSTLFSANDLPIADVKPVPTPSSTSSSTFSTRRPAPINTAPLSADNEETSSGFLSDSISPPHVIPSALPVKASQLLPSRPNTGHIPASSTVKDRLVKSARKLLTAADGVNDAIQVQVIPVYYPAKNAHNSHKIRLIRVHNTDTNQVSIYAHAADVGGVVERKSNISRMFGKFESPSEKLLMNVVGAHNHLVGQESNILTCAGIRRFLDMNKMKDEISYRNWIIKYLIPRLQLDPLEFGDDMLEIEASTNAMPTQIAPLKKMKKPLTDAVTQKIMQQANYSGQSREQRIQKRARIAAPVAPMHAQAPSAATKSEMSA